MSPATAANPETSSLKDQIGKAPELAPTKAKLMELWSLPMITVQQIMTALKKAERGNVRFTVVMMVLSMA
jgi:hypothetical protein